MTLAGWYYDLLHIFAYIYVGLLLVNAFVFKDQTLNIYLIFMIPPLLTDIVTGATMDDFADLARYIIYVPPVATAYTFVIVQTIRQRKNIKFDYVMKGFLIYFITMIPSFFVSMDLYNSFLMMMLYLNAFLLFMYFNSQKDIKRIHFMIMCFLFALVSVLQMYYIFYQGDIVEMILRKQISIGWSVSNNIGQYIVFAIPFIVYLAGRYEKYSYGFYFLLFVFVVSLLMTGARASWLALLIITPFCGYFMYWNMTKKRLIRDTLILVPLIAISMYFLITNDITQAIYERILNKGLDSSSRLDIWINSIEHFKQYPLFGSGLLSTPLFEPPLTSYHNIIVDALTNTGIIGFIGTIYFGYAIVKTLFKNSSNYNFMFGLALVTFIINALLDTAHLNPIILMFIFTSFAFIERKSEHI